MDRKGGEVLEGKGGKIGSWVEDGRKLVRQEDRKRGWGREMWEWLERRRGVGRQGWEDKKLGGRSKEVKVREKVVKC